MDDMSDSMVDARSKGSSKTKWIIFFLIFLILAGGGFFAYTFFFQKDQPDDTQAQTEEGMEGEADTPAQLNDTVMVNLPTFLVNLADPLGRRYIKLTIDVEVRNKEISEELQNAEPKVRDAINLLLSSKSYADLSTLESKILLKEEIVKRLNLILGGPKVHRVYFTEMVIQ